VCILRSRTASWGVYTSFLDLPQDVVAEFQAKECGLKYEIHSPGDQFGLQISTPKFSLGSFKYVKHMLTIYN
jgi:hypothetical protein